MGLSTTSGGASHALSCTDQQAARQESTANFVIFAALAKKSGVRSRKSSPCASANRPDRSRRLPRAAILVSVWTPAQVSVCLHDGAMSVKVQHPHTRVVWIVCQAS